VSCYQKGKTNLDFTDARDSEWQWHQLGRMQIYTLLQTDNHASTPPLSFFTVWLPFLPPNQQRQSTEGKRAQICVLLLLLFFKAHQHKAAGRKIRLDIQNYGCNGNLLCYHGVVERNRISCYYYYYYYYSIVLTSLDLVARQDIQSIKNVLSIPRGSLSEHM